MSMFDRFKKTEKSSSKSPSAKFDYRTQMEASILQEKFTYSKNEKAKWDTFFNDMEARFSGDRVFNNITTPNASSEARTILRLFHMLTEAQVNLDVPNLLFKAVWEEDEEAVKQLQSSAEAALRCNDLDTINSTSEREVKRYGTEIYKVVWDDKYQRMAFKGRPKVILVHPKNFIPYAGSIDKNELQGCYHVYNMTLQECIQKFGDVAKRLPEEGEYKIEYDTVGKDSGTKLNKTIDIRNEPNIALDPYDAMAKYTIIEDWNFDADGDTQTVIFSGTLILKTIPKYWYRRSVDPDTQQIVDGKYWEEENPLNPYEPISKYSNNPSTKNTFDKSVKFYVPKELPFVIQNNIPRSKCIWGISDGEIIGDLEESIKKMMHKIEEGVLKGSTKVFYREQAEPNAAAMIDNDDLTFIPVEDPGNFKEVHLKAENGDAFQLMEWLVAKSQELLQINKSFQGRNEGESTSGKMALALINQSQERVNVKVNEKIIAYKKIYRLICDYLLTFSDGDRPYRLESGLKPKYGVFNRYDILKQDRNGEWIYPDYDIEISTEASFPKTKTFLFQSTIEMAQGGFLQPMPQNVLVWTLLSKIGYPNAEIILNNIQEQIQQQQQQAMMQGQAPTGEQLPPEGGQQPMDINQVLSQLPEDVKAQFENLPEEEKQQALQYVEQGGEQA